MRATHQEFGARVSLSNNVASHWHATHVAGTIGAGGVEPNAKGMAPAVSIDSYDWNDDQAETLAAAAAGPEESAKLYLSNHSYGFVVGWAYGSWSGNSGWHWLGRDLGEGEDHNFGRYRDVTEEWDALTVAAPYFLPVWAAGNDRNDGPPSSGATFYYYSTHPPGAPGWRSKTYDPNEDPPTDGWKNGGYNTVSGMAVAKNVLTVGAVSGAVDDDGKRDLAKAAMSAFSCWGPTDDGRIKPDIVGNGISLFSPIDSSDSDYAWASGTSMAAPNAAGSAALLVDLHRALFDGQNMRAATLKGLLIHTADSLGNPGPDYRHGWGLMNTLAAADHLRRHAAYPDLYGVVEGVLNENETDTYTFYWNGTAPVRATVSWTDPAGPVRTDLNDPAPVLVNDLNLRIVGPDDTVYLPYVLDPLDRSAPATTDVNVLDNVEQVFIPAGSLDPQNTGPFRVEIDHAGTLANGQQPYALLLDGTATPRRTTVIRIKGKQKEAP